MADGDDTPFVDSNIWLYALVEGDDPAKTTLARRAPSTSVGSRADPLVRPASSHEGSVWLFERPIPRIRWRPKVTASGTRR